MDLTINWTHIITIATFIIGGWIAIRNANQKQLSDMGVAMAQMETRISHIERRLVDTTSLSTQIAALSTKVDDLRRDVEKHNNLVERMALVESQQKTMWKRQDELRDGLHDVKVGGLR